mgnify:CR=1 FL=1
MARAEALATAPAASPAATRAKAPAAAAERLNQLGARRSAVRVGGARVDVYVHAALRGEAAHAAAALFDSVPARADLLVLRADNDLLAFFVFTPPLRVGAEI